MREIEGQKIAHMSYLMALCAVTVLKMFSIRTGDDKEIQK